MNRVRWGRGWLLLLALWFAPGCRSPRAGTASAGFTVPGVPRQGQAVWRRSAKGEELTGDLVVATGGPGSYVVEFSKPALPLVRVSRQGERWEVQATGRGRRSGRGRSPALCWFVLGDFLSGSPALRPPWLGEWDGGARGWWIENPRTGERIEGYLEEP